MDTFGTREGLRTWLVERGLPAAEAPVTERERRDLVKLREALRAIVAAHGSTVPSDALRTVATAARKAELVVAIDAAGHAELQPAGRGSDALVARLLGDIAVAQRVGSWRDRRICRRDACRWAFHDASRNHSGVWCTMSLCGNRVKSANLRRRRARDRVGSATRD